MLWFTSKSPLHDKETADGEIFFFLYWFNIHISIQVHISHHFKCKEMYKIEQLLRKEQKKQLLVYEY